MAPKFSVVIACYSDERFPDTCDAIRSSLTQDPPPFEVVVVVDHNPDLVARVAEEFGESVVLVENTGEKGAAGSRNAGSKAASGDLLAFLDDDAVASPGWLAALDEAMRGPDVVGAGGRIDPIWQGGRPRWFPAELGWVVGATFHDPRTGTRRVRNVWAGNMCISAERFCSVEGFRGDFSKVDARSRPEDTEFCVRVARATPGAHWVFAPKAVVGHQVPAARSTFGFFIRRCWMEGAGKAEMAALLGWRTLSAEGQYTATVIPRAVARHLGALLRGDRAGLARAGAAVAGFLITLIATGVTAVRRTN